MGRDLKQNKADDIYQKKIAHLNTKTVYGPVKSWRFKMSLGVDPIYKESTCSFNCFYCQLGEIQNKTRTRKIYVSTKKILDDFSNFLQQKINIDVIAFSGSGEPTLAINLNEISKEMRKLKPDVPHIVLTNGTLLQNKDVQKDLLCMDQVIIKLDACNENTLQKINRPVDGITFFGILNGIMDFKNKFKGTLDIQSMFCSLKDKNLVDFANIINKINPSSVQLNTPKRPYPLSWHRENRGNHDQIFNYPVQHNKTISKADAEKIEQELKKLASSNILSIYH